ncbi:hypothetical protein GCM10023189_38060 [Nibrella saemangeumensis]|uniref:Outer membrane efflux protein n=1 Tax=Nibrella saemangeumensis TaxID=1084526 RepID=A0ABP8N960_9BACT
MFTPRTPRPFFFLLLGVATLTYNSTNAQKVTDLSLQPIQIYENSLKNYYYQRWQAERKEFQITHQKGIWQYTPSIGLVFGLPSVNWNPYQLFQAKQDKRVLAAKLASIDDRYQVEYNETIMKLRADHKKIQIEAARYKMLETEFFHQQEIQSIHTEAYMAKDITPLQFKEKHTAQLNAQHAMQNKEIDMMLMIIELEKLARYEMPAQKLSDGPPPAHLEALR